MSRMITQKMSESMKQTIVVDNRPGAGGQIGASWVRQQPADGYTLLYGDIGPFAMNGALYKNLSYDMARDFTPVARLFESPVVVIVPPNSEYKTFADLIAASKSGKTLNYGSFGVGSHPHVWSEMLRRQVGGSMTHIPYKGAAPALQDVMGGRIDFMVDVTASSIPLVKDGKVRALAVVGSKTRLVQLPDVPTLAELGYGAIDVAGWNGVAVRSGTPQPVVDRLYQEIAAAIAQPDVTKRYTDFGLVPAPMPPVQFADFLKSESERWGGIIKAAGITVE
jgi:tripartite-type tricarboxylate transporter receptor subunit TctC